MAGTRFFLTEDDEKKVIQAITDAEKITSGEIRVHIEKHCTDDAFKRAVKVFEKLKMHKTKLKNGVLFYVASEDRKFTIIGDKGINEKVPEDFWNQIKDYMSEKFKAGECGEGLIEGILRAGDQLKTHFPYEKGDIDELVNNISYYEN